MNNFKTKTLIIGLGVAFMAAGCENVPEVYKGALDLPQPEVSVASTSSHQIQFNGNAATLSEGEKTALREFIYQEGVQYGDGLTFDFARGDSRIWEKKQALDDYLKTIGVWVDDVTQSGNNPNASAVVFIVTRYQATTPDCYALSKESFVPTEMEKNKIFGCITAHNHAAHVANKRDLVDGQPDTPPLTQASVRAIQLYRALFGTQITQSAQLGGSSSGGRSNN